MPQWLKRWWRQFSCFHLWGKAAFLTRTALTIRMDLYICHHCGRRRYADYWNPPMPLSGREINNIADL